MYFYNYSFFFINNIFFYQLYRSVKGGENNNEVANCYKHIGHIFKTQNKIEAALKYLQNCINVYFKKYSHKYK